jgi:hypothetical protein
LDLIVHKSASTLTAQIPQFGPGQQQAALALIEQMAWGDIDYAIRGVEETLRVAIDATRAEFLRWEEELEPTLGDEFPVPAAQVEEMSDADKIAYLARLLRSLALQYGVTGRLGEADDNSPAALLRGLLDISWMPCAPNSCEP